MRGEYGEINAMFTDMNMLSTETPTTPATMSLQGLSEHLATHFVK
jgi:hypothetical protein